MSPEQVRGELDRLGAPTDVYGLGATLYHLLTGEPPLRGVHGTEVFRRVEQGKIPAPRAVNRRVPRALDADLPQGDGPAAGGPLPLAARPGRGPPPLAGRRVGLGLSRVARGPARPMGRGGTGPRSGPGVAALIVVAAASVLAAGWFGQIATVADDASRKAQIGAEASPRRR